MKKIFLIVGVLSSIFLANLFMPKAFALSGSEFQAGRIMDDGIFFSSNSINPQQIQTFLDSKVPSCDTYGNKPYGGTTRASYGTSKGYPPPYVCLRNYSQSTPDKSAESGLCGTYSGGTKSAAQIIYDVGQACGVNPRVLIVLLQKEQSLVTDDWPWSKQYRSATGYGCPDTAPCDAEYYGFFNQVYSAARQFKKYSRDAANYSHKSGRDNFVRFNPNSACGGSTVYIRNQATAGLYNYTPYQPNASALNNLYGSGDGCGAYGNRNFWRMYNDWFGSTFGAMIRTESSGALYYSDGSKRFSMPSMELASQFGLGLSDVRFVSDFEMNSIPIASTPFSNTLGDIVKSESDSDADGGALYLISDSKRIPIASMSQFSEFGFNTGMIKYLPLSIIERVPQAPNALSYFVKSSDNAILKVESNKLRTIFELSKLNELNPGGNITSLSQFTFSKWGFGTPLVDGDYVVSGPQGALRQYNGNQYFNIPYLNIYDCWNLSTVKTFKVATFAVVNGTSKGNLTCIAQNSGSNGFTINKTYRTQLASTSGLPVVNPSDALINRLPVSSLKPVVRGAHNDLFVLENNKRRPIPSLSVYAELGFGSNSVSTMSDSALKAFPIGAKKLSIGTIMKEPGGALSVVTSDTSRLMIPTMQQYDYFNFSANPSVSAGSLEQTAYPSAGNLNYYIKVGSNLYLVDEKVHYLIDPSLDTHFGVNRASLPNSSSRLLSKTLSWDLSRFIKSKNNSAVYYVENGSKRPISSWQRVQELGGANSIVTLSGYRVNSLPTGPSI